MPPLTTATATLLSAIIASLSTAGTAIFGGKMQKDIIEEGQEEAREIRREDIRERRKARKSSERLARRQIAENRRQFDLSLGLQREGLGLTREQMARTTFRDQVSNLTNVFNKNENMKNLFINRLSTLRG